MHMPDLSDEELDALFRQGAEGYPEELNLGAWARMEQQLDDARVLVQVVMNNDMEADSVFRVRDDANTLSIEPLPYSLEEE